MKRGFLFLKIAVALIVICSFLFDWLEYPDLRLMDRIYQRPNPVNNDIIIVGIDDESLEHFGKWPWDRRIMATAIEKLSSGKPAVIGVDVIYAEKSLDEAEDKALVSAASKANNLVFSAYCSFGEETEDYQLQINGLTLPFDELAENSESAVINVVPDDDGILRRAFLGLRDNEGEYYESLSYKLYRKYCEVMGFEYIRQNEIVTDVYNRIFIDYAGGPSVFAGNDDSAASGFEHVSIASVINGDIPPEYFYNKIVMVGVTSMGVPDDYYFTPLLPHSPMYGLEVHANVVTQLINGSFSSFMSNMQQLLLLAGIAALMIAAARLVKPGFYSVFVLGLALLMILLIYSAYRQGLVVSVFYILLMILTEYVLSLVERAVLLNNDKKKIQNIFGRYMEPKIINQLISKDISELTLGGKTLDISVLFVDIRGFTTMSEGLSPEIVVGILNAYLKLCSSAIFKFGGTLDKYIGDCAMAIYNAPLPMEEHELAAVKSGLDMISRAGELNAYLKEKYGREIEFGVGIHTGPAVVGNIGCDFRMDYTAIGDTVNSAARLQGKAEGGQVLVSERVYEKIKDYVEADLVGSMEVKGKLEQIKAYSIKGLKEVNNVD